MQKKRFQSVISALALCGAFALGTVTIHAQGRPWHPAPPGHLNMTPLFPVGMQPRGHLPYSWEIGKDRTQRFGEFSLGDRDDLVKRLIKRKRKELEAEAKRLRANRRGPTATANNQ